MAHKNADIEDVMKELKIIKKLVLKDLQLDMEELKLDKRVLGIGRDGAGKKPHTKKTKRIFDDRIEWQEHIWDGCKYKKMVSGKDNVSYLCKIANKTCHYLMCPLNIKR